MTKKQFLEKVSSLVLKENEKRKFPLFSSVVIAQACLETGYGKSSLMLKANAIFGIKATKTWKGKVYNSKTKECYDGKKYTIIEGCFRAYNSLEEGIEDYFDLICRTPRYRKAIVSETPEECIQAIKDGGYATDPKYVNSVLKIIKTNNLTQYDVKKEEKTNNDYKEGNTYFLQTNLNVRVGAGTNYRNKKYSELTKDGRKHALNQSNAVLKRGTKITCKKIIIKSNEIWLEIPSGFICAKYGDKIYVK